MAVDESSSQDATLIDDDLVSALGFEPVESSNGNGVVDIASASDRSDAVAVDEVAVDEAALDEVADDEVAVDEAALDEVAADEVVDEPVRDEAVVDEVVDEPMQDEAVVDEAVVDEAVVDEAVVDEAVVDEAADDALTDEPVDDEAVGDDQIVDHESPTDDAGIELEDELAEAGGEPASTRGYGVVADDPTTGDAPGDPADAVAAGGGSFFDLDLDEDDSVAEPPTDETANGETDTVIDLDRLEAGESSPMVDGQESTLADDGAEALDLADPDSVFADADVAESPLSDTGVVDPEVAVGDHGDRSDGDAVAPLDAAVLVPTTFEPAVADEEPAPLEEAVVAPAARPATVKRRRRLRARKSRRVIRHIDPWSVLTFSVLFHMVVFGALLLSSVLVWNAAIASGMVENVESFIQELGDYETFTINADVMFRAAIVIAGMLTLASSVMVVLLTVVFNLISDLVGGIRVTVIEEETVRVPIDKNRSRASADRVEEDASMPTTAAIE